MANKKIFKNLLTTASAIAVLASAQSSLAGAAGRRDVGNANVDLGAIGAFVDGDAVRFDAAAAAGGGAVEVTAAAGGPNTVSDIITADGINGVFTLQQNLKVNGNVFTEGGGNSTLQMKLGNHVLTYSGLRLGHWGLKAGEIKSTVGAPGLQSGAGELTVQFDFAGGANSALNLTGNGAIISNVTLANSAANDGVVTVSDNITFNKVTTNNFAGNTMQKFVVDAGKKLTVTSDSDLTNVASALELGAASTLEVKDTSQVGDVTAAGAATVIVDGTTAAVRDIDIKAGVGTVTLKSTTAGQAARDVTLGGGGTVTVESAADVNSVDLQAAGTVNLNGTGAVDSVNFNAADSTINFGGASTLTALRVNVGATKGIVNVNESATIGRISNGTLKQVNFKNDKVLTLTLAAGVSKIQTVSTDTNETGSLYLGTPNLASIESIGSDDKVLKEVKFNDDATLTVTGKNFYVKNVVSKNNDEGTIIFTSAPTTLSKTTFGTKAGPALKAITVQGKTDVDFGDSLVNVNAINFKGADAKATIKSVGNNNMKINADAAGDGQLTFANDADVTVNTVGAARAVGSVKLSGKGKVSTAEFTSNALSFAADTTLESSAGVNVNGAITTETDGQGTVKFAADSIADSVGADGKKLKALIYTGGGAATWDANNGSIFADVQSTGTALLTLNNLGNNLGATYLNLGTKDGVLAGAKFVNNATVKGEVYSQNVTIAPAAGVPAVRFEKTVDGIQNGTIEYTGNATLTFANGANIANASVINNTKVGGVAVAAGTINFEGSHAIGAIGQGVVDEHLLAVNFKGVNCQEKLGGGISADDINLGTNNTYTIAQDTGLGSPVAGGVIKANQTVFVLNNDSKGAPITLALVSDLVANNAFDTVKFVINSDGNTTSKIIGGAARVPGAAINFQGYNWNNVTFEFANSGLIYASDTVLPLAADITDIGKNVANLKTVSKGLTKFNIEATGANSIGTKTTSNVAEFAKANDLSSQEANLVEEMYNEAPALTTGAGKLLTFISNNPTSAKESIGKTRASVQTSAIVSSAAQSALNSVISRIAHVGSSTAIAAGDEAEMGYGVWANGFGSRATQKARKGNDGYKTNFMGGTVGADTQFNDSTMVGLAFTYGNGTVKFKDTKAGDKTKLSNMFFNLYGKHDLANNWFVQGAAGFGSGKVKTTRTTGILDKAYGKFDTLTANVEAMVGYNTTLMNNVALVPMAGLRYVNVNESGYTETGSAAAATFTKRTADKITGTLGASVSTSQEMQSATIMPEVHAFVNYDMRQRNPKVEARYTGFSKAIDLTANKADKLNYRVGGSLTAKTGNVEYGVGYDATLAKKFVGHQGSLRVRVDL